VPNILISVPTKKVKQPLSVTHPELAKEAYGWDPKEITAGSNRKLTWICNLGHIWTCAPDSRILQEVNCQVCAGRILLTGFNDFATLYPDLAKEAHGWDPTKENIWFRKVDWKCSEGHIWNSLISQRVKAKGCLVCAGKRVIPGSNDLATLRPDIASEAHGWDPSTVTTGSSRKFEWICTLGHTWITDVKHRTNRGDGCPTCDGKVVLEGFNDFASKQPELALEADGWDPRRFTETSGVRVRWKCKLGHTWEVRIADRTFYKTGCPTCSGRQVLYGFNDLETRDPRIAQEANGWDPKAVHFHSNKKYSWKCKLGHEWLAVVESRVIQNTDCLVCGNRQLLTGFNDLATKFPHIAREASGWDATKVMSGSNSHLWWKCEEGHKWRARVADRTGQLTGCPNCSKTGFSPDRPGYLYFLGHDLWEMYQIGITNDPDTRLSNHHSLGWETIELRGPIDGHLAAQSETSILRMLQAKGADLSNSKIAGKFDGYSEAWSKSTFEVKSIQELMRLTEEFESN
jgi:hypothetical protein